MCSYVSIVTFFAHINKYLKNLRWCWFGYVGVECWSVTGEFTTSLYLFSITSQFISSANVSISNAYNYWNLLLALLNDKCNSKSKHLLALTFLITQAYNTYHLARMKYESKVCSNSKTESKSRWYSSIYNTDEYVFLASKFQYL